MSLNSISSFSISNALSQSILQSQTNLANAEIEVSTGHYANIDTTLGGEASQVVNLQEQNDYLTTLTGTNNIATARLSTTQSALTSLLSSAQTFLSDLVGAPNTTNSASALQSTAQSALSSLISNLNTSYNGTYLFAGINTSATPMTDYYGPSSANQAAVNSAFSTAFGMTQSSPLVSTITGPAMQSFLNTQYPNLFQGTNWTSAWSSASDTVITNQISPSQTAATSVSANQAAFKQLASAYTMMANLGTQNLGSSAYQAVLTTATKTMTTAISDLTDLQASVGSVQSQITESNNQMSLNQTYLATQVSNLVSVNPATAAVQVTNLQTQIETAYSLTAQLQKLSLVNYL
jgi:flagellar hook-associated protein 3 FlgL